MQQKDFGGIGKRGVLMVIKDMIKAANAEGYYDDNEKRTSARILFSLRCLEVRLEEM